MEKADVGSAGGSANALPAEQPRSAQPWVSQISAQAIDQVRNVVQSKGKDAGPSKARNRGDDVLSLTILQQQMDELEDRFSLQLQRLQARTERQREAETRQWEERLGISDFSQRRLAELSKSVNELEDQLHLQIQRLDQMMGNLSTWQRQVGEDMKEHYRSVKELAENISCSLREETGEAAECRSLVRNHDLQLTKIQEALHLLPELAERCRSNSQEQESVDHPASIALNDLFEARTTDLDRKVEDLLEDKCSILQRVEAQEERLRSLRTHTEASNSQITELQAQISTMSSIQCQEVLDQVEKRVFTQDHILQSLQSFLTTTSDRVDDLAAAFLRIRECAPSEPIDAQCASQQVGT